MVSSTYLLGQPGPLSPRKKVFDQQVVPAMIDAAAGVEAALEQVARRARRQPLPVIGAALGVGFLLGRMIRR